MTSSNQRGSDPLNPPTVVDVLENALGDLSGERVGSLGVPELDELAEAVNSLYESWRTPALGTDEVRFYSGGWIAGNLEMDSARQYLYTNPLYAPSVVFTIRPRTGSAMSEIRCGHPPGSAPLGVGCRSKAPSRSSFEAMAIESSAINPSGPARS